MKRIIFISSILYIILLFMFPQPVYANSTIVVDEAGVFSESSENIISDFAVEVAEKKNIDIMFLTLNNIPDNYQSYINQYHSEYNLDADCIIFTIVLNNEEFYINTYGAAIEGFSSNVQSMLLSMSGGYFERYNFQGLFLNCVSAIESCDFVASENYFEKDSHISKNKIDLSILVPTGPSIVISLIVTLLVVGILLIVHFSANRRLRAVHYLKDGSEGFNVEHISTRYCGSRQEIIRGFYQEKSKD